MKKSIWAVALTSLAGLAGSGVAQAQVFHLLVDLTNPSAAVITATSENALLNSNTTIHADGATLQGFFTSSIGSIAYLPVTGDLGPSTSGIAYESWDVDEVSSGVETDLSLFNSTFVDGGQIQEFFTGTPAFVGSATLDLSSVAAFLPTVGASGDIYAGFSLNLGPVVGSWQVVAVPEVPAAAQCGIYAVGLAGLWMWRRVKRG